MGLLKGPKGPTDEFYGFMKAGKRSNFFIDSYLNERKGYLSREKWYLKPPGLGAGDLCYKYL